MDEQMERLVLLGILSKKGTSHTSPVMLITRKITNDKRPVVDFQLLNMRILRRNTSIPLMKDVLSIWGNSKCELMSCVDIKDAYHSIPLTKKSKEYCGILPYLVVQFIGMKCCQWGYACAPQIWMDYITLILGEFEDKAKYITIMYDLLIHSTKAEHWLLVEQLLQSMIKNGLRLSPMKCQFPVLSPKKTVHTPKQGSISKEVPQRKTDPVRVSPSQITTDKSGKSPVECTSGTP